VPLAGRPMIAWSLDACAGCEAVTATIVAAPPGLEHGLGGDVRVVDGGATRAESVANALAAVATELVAIHDAARPLLTAALLDELVALLDSEPDAAGAIAAAPVSDTVKRSRSAFAPHRGPDAHLAIEATLDRGELWAAQTPQVFRTAALRAALEVDEETRDAATDESMLVEAAGGTVLLHPVGEANFKVTSPHDLRFAEVLLAERASRELV
jgi:2-C-methyl-D-erythritol 4-phosphate cytidylyltransferase